MGQVEIDAVLDRLEAALAAAEGGAPEDDGKLRALEAELLDARQRVMTLESEAGEREAALGTAVDRAEAAETALAARPAVDDDEVEALRRQVAELRAARTQDLAEMKALLAELEPLMPEAAHA